MDTFNQTCSSTIPTKTKLLRPEIPHMVLLKLLPIPETLARSAHSFRDTEVKLVAFGLRNVITTDTKPERINAKQREESAEEEGLPYHSSWKIQARTSVKRAIFVRTSLACASLVIPVIFLFGNEGQKRLMIGWVFGCLMRIELLLVKQRELRILFNIK